MQRRVFIASAASAITVSLPLLAKAEDVTKRARVGTNAEASGWPKPTWQCASTVVWLDTASGTYSYKGEPSYGCTERGAYTCEDEAIGAGYYASLDSLQ